MSYSHKITIMGGKSATLKAKAISERRRQAQAWLRRNKDQKKQSEAVKK
jgi:hypothetical protein